MAACGAAEPVRLRIRGARLADPLVREWRQPFVIVGRSPRADLHLDSPEIGNPQAYLQFVAGHLFAVDLQGGARLLAGTGGNAWMGAEAVHFGPYSVEWMAAAPAAAPEWSPLLSHSGQLARLPLATLELRNTADRQPPRRLNRMLALVGSAPACNVRLISSTVAAFHCSLLRTPMGLWVVDLLGGSGVRVNGLPARFARLQDGDELRIGKFRLRVGLRPATEVSARSLPAASSSVSRVSAPSWHSARPEHSASADHEAVSPAADSSPAAPADLSAHSLGDLALVRRDEPFLLPVVQQLQVMQQQMLDHFQETMILVVQKLSALHREQLECLRESLGQLQGVTQGLHVLQKTLREENPPDRRRNGHGAAAPASAGHSGATQAETCGASSIGVDASPSPPSGAVPIPGDESIHAWLTNRIAALQHERQSQWQKILQLIGGK